jgi:hypothetical protein
MSNDDSFYIGYLVRFYDPAVGRDRATLHNTLKEAFRERDALNHTGLRGAAGQRYVSVTRIDYWNETDIWRNGRKVKT